jgi:small subunit ribosomal protein S17
MDKTVVVRIDVVNTDKVYGKKFLRSKKFKVHDPREEYKVGDVVQIEESRHLSRDKYYRIVKKVK